MFFAAINVPKDVEIQKHLTSIHINSWIKQDVFHFSWWLLISLVFIFLIVWWKLIYKSKLHVICLYAVLSTIFVLGIDEYGDELTLWDYPTDIIPIFRPLTSINLLILPLVFSLAYQYFKTKKNFVWGSIIISTIICIVFEPLLSLAGLYQLLHWKYYFSIPVYSGMAILIRAVVVKITIITEKYEIPK